MLLAKPGFTAAAVLVLALGIGANSAVFSLVNAFLFKPLHIEKPEQLAGLYSRDTKHPDSYRGFSYPNYVDIRDHNPAFSSLAALNLALIGIQEGDATRRSFAAVVSSNYFSTLGVTLAKGRPFLAADEQPGGELTAIVNDSFWEKKGEDPQLIGKPLRINGHVFTIIGITPKGFTGTTALVTPEMFLPLNAYGLVMNDFDGQVKPLSARDNHALMLIGRLMPGMTPQAADATLAVVASQMEKAYPAENKDQTLLARPLSRSGFSTSPQSDASLRVPAIMLLSLAAVILLIASLNLANMMMAKGTARRKEIAIRLAIGGGRRRIVRQLVTEGLLLAILGGAAGSGRRLLEHHSADSIAIAARAHRYCLRRAPGCAGARIHAVVLRAQHRGVRALSGLEALQAGRLDRPQGKYGRGFSGPQAPPVLARQHAGDGAVIVVIDDARRGRPVRAQRGARIEHPAWFRLENEVIAEVDASLIDYDEAHGNPLYARLKERLRQVPASNPWPSR